MVVVSVLGQMLKKKGKKIKIWKDSSNNIYCIDIDTHTGIYIKTHMYTYQYIRTYTCMFMSLYISCIFKE